ncbi:hypothetical protein, partial [Rhodobium orientis]|uniref:hypothetical protein n=1 Tax=Rhodobium orientis TaxID=34017 RepID=UPI001AEC7401
MLARSMKPPSKGSSGQRSNRLDQKIEHRIFLQTMVREKAEFTETALHVLRANKAQTVFLSFFPCYISLTGGSDGTIRKEVG